jgi:DinB superfamily
MKTTIALLMGLSCFATAADMTVARLYDSQLSQVESEIVPLVKEMPESAFGFAPKEGAFKNARTFAQQTKHVATVMYMVSAAALQQKVPIDLGTGEEGPANVKTKDQIIKYLNDAFAYAHKAMNSLTDKNQLELVKAPFPGAPDMARAGIANVAIGHTFDHYGQMVIYARMNNIVPPASR